MKTPTFCWISHFVRPQQARPENGHKEFSLYMRMDFRPSLYIRSDFHITHVPTTTTHVSRFVLFYSYLFSFAGKTKSTSPVLEKVLQPTVSVCWCESEHACEVVDFFPIYIRARSHKNPTRCAGIFREGKKVSTRSRFLFARKISFLIFNRLLNLFDGVWTGIDYKLW